MLSRVTPALDILIRAKQLIVDPARWCQGTIARNAEGNPVSSNSDLAVRWCSLGAILSASVDDPAVAAVTLLNQAAADMGEEITDGMAFYEKPYAEPMLLAQLNDERDHDAVMEMFDRAIAAALVSK